MSTKTKPAAVANHSTPSVRMASHEGLRQAREKLNRLDSERAAVQARLDQHRAARADSENIARKILSGEEITAGDSLDTEHERAKLKAYELALAQQNAEVERQLREASRLVCDAEANEHRTRAAELAESASRMVEAFEAMESHVNGLRIAGVQVDNRFPIYEGMRLRTLVMGLKPIAEQFRRFSQD